MSHLYKILSQSKLNYEKKNDTKWTFKQNN